MKTSGKKPLIINRIPLSVTLRKAHRTQRKGTA